VIEALSALPRHERPRVVCAGSADGHEQQLRDWAHERGVDDALEILGWVPQEEVQALYGQVLGTLNPSRYEGYGLPVAESLAQGLPTVASDIGPHREIAAGAAAYFPPGDAQALAALMDRLTKDRSLREKLASDARRRASELTRGTPSWADLILDAAAPSPIV
jgi:alpha-1,3-rhamnosyl/mannosyltransferase